VPDPHAQHSTISLTVYLHSYNSLDEGRRFEDSNFALYGLEYDVSNLLLIIAHFEPPHPLPLKIAGVAE
jgi:hypothetical protein